MSKIHLRHCSSMWMNPKVCNQIQIMPVPTVSSRHSAMHNWQYASPQGRMDSVGRTVHISSRCLSALSQVNSKGCSAQLAYNWAFQKNREKKGKERCPSSLTIVVYSFVLTPVLRIGCGMNSLPQSRSNPIAFS